MRESIFFASIRALFVTFFSVIGITLGFVALVIMVGTASTSDQITSKSSYTPIAVADAQGKRKVLDKNTPVILKINIEGIVGADQLTTTQFQQLLIESRDGILENDRVKAVVLRINSPGGTVHDADGIYRAIKSYKEEYHTPVIAYVDGLCLSGGMYIAAAADKIYSADTGLIGSVGVILPPFFNATNLMEKIGLQALTIYSGKGKDEMNPTRPWKKDEDASLALVTKQYYDHFVSIVTASRPLLSKEKLIDEYGAGIFLAKEAIERGYIDEIKMNFAEVLQELSEKIGAKNNEYQVVEMSSTDWFSKIFGKQDGGFAKGETKFPIALPLELQPELAGKWLYLHR